MRKAASPPVTQNDTVATPHSIAQPQRVATPTHQPGAIRTADDIITDVPKPHRKLVAQVQARAEAEKTIKPQRRKGNVYSSRQVNHRRANRVYDRQEYHAWSDEQLLREVNLRRLRSEGKDHADLVDNLIINDNKFEETWYKFEELSVHELLEEAEINHVDVDFGKHWVRQELLTLIADKMSQHAVNDLPRAEVAARRSAQAQTAQTSKAPSMDNGRSKVTKRSQKAKDRATLRKTVEDFAKELFEADAAKHSPIAGTKKEVSLFKSEKTGGVPARKATSKTIAKKVGQKFEKDGRCPKLIPSGVFVTCTMTNDGKGKCKSAAASSEKKLYQRRDSEQGLLHSSPLAQQKDASVMKKRSLPLEKNERSEETQSNARQTKRMRMATDTMDSLSSENGDEDIEEGGIDDHASKRQAAPERKKLVVTGTARSKESRSISPALKEISPTVPKVSLKRSIFGNDDMDSNSSGDIPLEEIARMKRRKSSQSSQEIEENEGRQNDRAIKKTNMKGIPPDERVKGIAYAKLADGSYKAAQRIQKIGKVSKAKAEVAKPSKNYIKR